MEARIISLRLGAAIRPHRAYRERQQEDDRAP